MIGKRSILVFAGIVLLSSIMACNEANLDSNWKAAAFSSDQPDSVWATSSVYSLEGKDISIGLQNDSDYLYILLRAADRQTQAKIMRNGLTVWLDPSGKKQKTFGVHYPLGMEARQNFPFTKVQRMGINIEELKGRVTEMADTMEVLGPGKNERKMVPIESDLGVAVMTSNDVGTITYELRVPLKATDSSAYALNVGLGKIVGVGLETGKFQPPKGDWHERGDRPEGDGGEHGGGFGGFGGHGGGMGGRGMGGHRGGRPPEEGQQDNGFEPLKFWGKVTLANGSNNQD